MSKFIPSWCRALLAGIVLTACGPSFRTATPPGFVELDPEQSHGPYDYRATTADGLVVAVREVEHDPQGSIEFWVRAAENELRQRGGYAKLDARDITTQQGLKGKQLRFGHDEANEPHLYYLTIIVTPDWIYLLEAGGKKALVEQNETQIAGLVTSFQAK